ncbi:DUF6529 family protein [Mycolicibacterium cosmeticum]|uniref:DUF6529 family protein n=1 Tax=Mycolicibacterium cosmeticum TaxID=258533 RepID=UPI0032046A81
MPRDYAEADTRLLAAPQKADSALLGAVGIGAAVAVALGAYGRLHTPQFFAVNIAGFSGPGSVKSWLATLAIALAVFQFVSALVMYRVLPGGRAPAWIGVAHVWSGRLAVLASVPVAVHCLYALGFQATDSRVLWHSLFGCFFYGAFVAKMILLTRKNLRPWVIPVLGGLVFFTLVNIWLTSALWFFQINGLTN